MVSGAAEIDAPHSALDFDLESARVTSDDRGRRRFARGGVRTLHTVVGGLGTSDTVRVNADTLLTVLNCVLAAPARWSYTDAEPTIMLRASMSCDVAFRLSGVAPMVFNRPELTLVALPAGRTLVAEITSGVRQQGMVAVFRGPSFARMYGLTQDELPPLLREALGSDGASGRLASFPLDPRIAALVSDTIDTRLEGELRVVQYAGRLAELVAYTLDAMQHAPALHGPALTRQRDADLAHAALARLEREYRKPPLFADLAHALGTNQNKLKAVFKSAFGLTMSDYCLDRRVREAQQLLLEASLTIAQVAERVGYEHQSSFTAAFSAHVGMSPRAYRQHRAPFSIALVPRGVRAANA